MNGLVAIVADCEFVDDRDIALVAGKSDLPSDIRQNIRARPYRGIATSLSPSIGLCVRLKWLNHSFTHRVSYHLLSVLPVLTFPFRILYLRSIAISGGNGKVDRSTLFRAKLRAG